jgi:hypothetical protein
MTKKVLIVIIIAVIAIAALGGIGYLTSGFRSMDRIDDIINKIKNAGNNNDDEDPDDEDPVVVDTYYLMIDGQKIKNAATNILIPGDGLKIDYHNTDSVIVTIVPSASVNIDFLVNGAPYALRYEETLTAGFDVTYTTGRVTITAPGDLQAILARLYPGKTVEVDLAALSSFANLFTARVESSEGAVINVTFGLHAVSGVTLPDTLEF